MDPINCYNYLLSGLLPDDVLCYIAKFLNVKLHTRLRKYNSKLRDTASKNSAGWKHQRTSLWSVKANVCSTALAWLAESNKINREAIFNPNSAAMEAYKVSVTDALTRKEVSFEEICFDRSPN